ncbi:predicted protein [Plenodomus lingam JN3]|uniref:Predicted protein n=1 Tax=Leptosphaeria maculans (strain JN3 / isolate v23.1.3 / race Av1-4-5-6-7-8) TaxID=985895 RepID=E5A456_LEPMJ|nr:predicted protein [Plenodomus lingam JN3]CBX98401.1 predicted protein [Plenodomus lingam JN3]
MSRTLQPSVWIENIDGMLEAPPRHIDRLHSPGLQDTTKHDP